MTASHRSNRRPVIISVGSRNALAMVCLPAAHRVTPRPRPRPQGVSSAPRQALLRPPTFCPSAHRRTIVE